MSREAILGRVRTALGRKAGQLPGAIPDAYLRPPAIDDLTGMFCTVLEKLGARAYRVSSLADAGEQVSVLVTKRTSIASNSAVLTECGVAGLPGVRSGVTDKQELRDLCASAEVGITSADFALADTGTLVMLSSGEEARMISLLPPVHVAVVPASRILSSLDQLLTTLPLPAQRTSSMVLITGTSRTGDIEQILVRGVHGPGEVQVVVVESA
jgi:L-lactate dehydrogenase complex protein LldG